MSAEQRRSRTRTLGEPARVHEGEPTILQIPSSFEGRPFDIWITDGMSERPMNAPDPALRRCELVFYAEPGFDYANALRAVTALPFDNDAFLDFGHTIRMLGCFFVPGGARALVSKGLPDVALPHVVLLDSILGSHRALFDGLRVGGDPVALLWVVPISPGEWALKRTSGVDALLDLFDERAHPWIFPVGGRERHL